jgi:regulator of sirC expression with transglutaminase-like and TPR domain
MMTTLVHTLPFWLTAMGVLETPAVPTHYVSSRQVVLSCQPAATGKTDRIHVWVSCNASQTWNAADVARTAENAVQYDAPADGAYRFYLILENAAGRSGLPPTPSSQPHVTAVVDTAPPTIQIHQAELSASPSGDIELQLRVSLIEENLGSAGIRVFYRASDNDSWQDGGIARFADGIIAWPAPPDASPTIDIRLLATDLAGNRSFDGIAHVKLNPTAPEKKPHTPQSDASAAENSDTSLDSDLYVPPVTPGTVPPLPQVTLSDDTTPAPETLATSRAEAKCARLRELAGKYLAQGRLSLATARLQDALDLVPDDPDLQVDLASILYRTRQYDEAACLFQQALDSSPDHASALEGLALVAATQNRYPQARSYLKRLLQLRPESGQHWLHYGDVEHLLGNTGAALDAWEKVLKIEPTDTAVRKKAQKRLKLFGPKRDMAH